jgi:hypothetical protein
MSDGPIEPKWIRMSTEEGIGHPIASRVVVVAFHFIFWASSIL